MTIQTGDKLPETKLVKVTENGPEQVGTGDRGDKFARALEAAEGEIVTHLTLASFAGGDEA